MIGLCSSGEGVVKTEAACPFCFIFDPKLLHSAAAIVAFDTGAFHKRLYKHILLEEMNAEDFNLGHDITCPNKMIAHVFRSQKNYYDGDITKLVDPEDGARPWEMLARSYLELLASRGRNEADDRICSVEIQFNRPVELSDGKLVAIIAPHTLWGDEGRAPWLEEVHAMGVEVRPYLFVPGRHPEHYHAHVECSVRQLYEQWGVW